MNTFTQNRTQYILLLCLLWSCMLVAQEPKLKVGLVLSGGGAKGYAHVSILKELESSGVEVSYIGGTSMGAVIGGLYAVGYSPVQIEALVLQTDFVSLLQDKFPRNSLPYFVKEFGEKYALSLPVTNNKVGLPKAVSKGQSALNLLAYLVSPADSITDFSKLPIPFFCVATDLETGKQVVLDKGSLGLSIRASSSFPTLLAPVTIDGKALIDGGVANNFPVGLMKSKGVDLIIGVDVQGKLNKSEDLNSLISILNQIINYKMKSNVSEKAQIADVYIKPNIYEFSVLDFNKKEEILEKGALTAANFKPMFDSIAKKQKPSDKRAPLVFQDPKLKFSKINVTGTNRYTRAYVLGKLNLQEGDSISRKELTKKLDYLSATNNYTQIEYKIKQQKTGNELQFSLIEDTQKSFLHVGAHYDLLYKSNILASYNTKNLIVNNDELLIDFIVGDRVRYNLNYFVDNGFYVSYGFRSRYDQFNTNTKFSPLNVGNVNSINLDYADFTNQLFMQTTFNRAFAIGFGVEHKHINIKTETLSQGSNDNTRFDNSDYLNVYSYLKLDTYDSNYFVKKGVYADILLKWYGSSSDFSNNFSSYAQLQGTVGFATTFWDRFTFQYTNEAGFSFESPTSNVFDFYLGGYNKNYINTFVSLYGYDFASLSGNAFLKSQFDFRYELFRNHYASLSVNYARIDDNVFKDGDIFKEVHSGYAIGYGLSTFLGPIELKYTWSPDNNQHFWVFNLGFWF